MVLLNKQKYKMTAKEIENLINQKGEPTKEVYNSLYTTFSIVFKENDLEDDFIDTLSYNITISFIDAILNNQSFYVPKFEITQTELETMRIDIDNMEHLEYPKKYRYIDTDGLEIAAIKILKR